MKFLMLLLLSVISFSCVSIKEQPQNMAYSLKNELNQSIIDGFFDGDTTKITKNTYFIK